MENEPRDERIVRANGWLLIRNSEDTAQWIATDSPAEVTR